MPAAMDVCHCTDWDISADAGRLRLRPSGRTIGKLLGASAFLVALALAMAWWYGFPPGSNAAAGYEKQAARAEQRAERAERKAAQLGPTVAGGSVAARGLLESLTREAGRLRAEVASARTRAEAARQDPSLGRFGDTAYWVAMAALLGLAVIVPLWGSREEIDLIAAGDGTLRLRRRFQALRSRRYHVEEFAALSVHAQRVIVRDRKHGYTDDQGWRWSVALLPRPDLDPDEARALVLYVEQEPTLPTRIERLTPRVRSVVSWLEGATGLACQPPTTTDVVNIEPGFLSSRWKLRTRRHGAVSITPPEI